MDSRHALTVLNRLAFRCPAETGKLARALRPRLNELAAVAIEVAVESGDPVEKVLAALLKKAVIPA
jgi:hypothetical protein